MELGTFLDTGVTLVKGFCSEETADILAEELFLARENAVRSDSKFKGTQRISCNTFSVFAPFDGALRLWMPKVESVVGASLVPINSFARIYGPGSKLVRHSDYSFLQVGVSICLRRDEVDWPLCITDHFGKDRVLVQQPGDAIIYVGQLCHWRDGLYTGTAQAQVFLHYCFAESAFASSHRFRGRKNLGLALQSPRSSALRAGHRRLMKMVKRVMSGSHPRPTVEQGSQRRE